ncbi:hypothetical protein ACT9ST_25945 (plasmid) [Sphingobium limneticum]|uniref:Uncharacterized protein n=1 Tax=Novosphingobium silvae TaxID=2692619 RepID=A0A7X4GJ06_9SPHN|nr:MULTISPECIES: hypothetical protein [Novosphingobium]MCC4253903.1 hypothetical protein [Sphingobium naphthae]MYL99121.1 hypothetical protein [Novosphingobium silvae]
MAYSFQKISDVKLRARKIAREQDIPRYQALDTAARGGGFQNFAHALKELPELAPASPWSNRIEISQGWWSRKERTGGQVAASISLKHALCELVKPHQLVETLGGCRIDGEARLISDGSMRDREASIIDVARVARALQFMDATGLKPSRSRRCYPKGDWDNRPPIADHDSCWFDPEARAYVLVTQPYPGRAAMRSEVQAAWEARHGWRTFRSDWGSMYGFGTELYLLCPPAYADLLGRKLADLGAGPDAITNEDVSDV